MYPSRRCDVVSFRVLVPTVVWSSFTAGVRRVPKVVVVIHSCVSNNATMGLMLRRLHHESRIPCWLCRIPASRLAASIHRSSLQSPLIPQRIEPYQPLLGAEPSQLISLAADHVFYFWVAWGPRMRLFLLFSVRQILSPFKIKCCICNNTRYRI